MVKKGCGLTRGKRAGKTPTSVEDQAAKTVVPSRHDGARHIKPVEADGLFRRQSHPAEILPADGEGKAQGALLQAIPTRSDHSRKPDGRRTGTHDSRYLRNRARGGA